MATNNENKTEREIYMDEVADYVSTFLNELEDDNAHVVERTVAQMKKRFALDDAQEAALQITLFHMETAVRFPNAELPFDALVGLECNIICDILLKDYRSICDHRLTDENIDMIEDYDEDDEDEMPAEVREAMRAYGEMLIDWYGSQVGAENVKYIDTATVLRRFRLSEDNKQAVAVLNRYKRGMDRYRKRGTNQEKVADLIDDTIERLMAVSEG